MKIKRTDVFFFYSVGLVVAELALFRRFFFFFLLFFDFPIKPMEPCDQNISRTA